MGTIPRMAEYEEENAFDPDSYVWRNRLFLAFALSNEDERYLR